jgi:hypothetical protein
MGLDPRADLRRVSGATATAASPAEAAKAAGATRAASPALGHATAEPAARAAEPPPAGAAVCILEQYDADPAAWIAEC